jgi:chromate transporter
VNPIYLGPADWLSVTGHFLSLSLFSFGGVLVTIPEMHHFLVEQSQWLTEIQFTNSIALAQAAPGPNVLFVALLGLSLGTNISAGLAPGPFTWWPQALGLLVALLGILLPSATIACVAGSWFHRSRSHPNVRAFTSGMAPIVIALLFATAWLMASSLGVTSGTAGIYALTLAFTLILWRTRVHVLWLIGTGAVIGGIFLS